MNVDAHDGTLLSARGVVRDLHRESFYAGAGAFAVGAGTVTIPGVYLTAHLADAIYAPQMAQQRTVSRNLDAEGVTNATLLAVATQYFALAEAEASLHAIRQSRRDLGEIVRLTANHARSGQGKQADADRALSEDLLLAAQEQAAEERVLVAAAELARLLSVDPTAGLRASEEPLKMVQMVDPEGWHGELIATALSARPELGARSADVAFEALHARQERARPLLPVIAAGASFGSFGGGSDAADKRLGHFAGRTDVGVIAVWSLGNLGFGNWAMQKRAFSNVRLAQVEMTRTADAIREEVDDGMALSEAQAREVRVAKRQLQAAESAYALDLTRAKNLEARPIEVLNSLTLLHTARQTLIHAITTYNQAQVRLFVALGRTLTPGLAQELSMP